ncbi:restriction endonuclease [Streptomyces sp. NBC_01483]|uniref:restriction endonuclease n=1 Tax=Streptomyces sp. NBC_01483 TaxID=2903883 RepID=UPI002E380434|nr:restriction endonuclease [Streptomyces sp. NBC_01483]
MAATHSTVRRTRRPARSRRQYRLPRLGWWWGGVTLIGMGVAKTWPALTIAAVALTGIILILRAVRPRRLTRILERISIPTLYRPALPARGRRTLDAFHRMTPARFEQAIAELAQNDPDVLQAIAVGQANDRGMDVHVHLTDGRRILIQCKHHEPSNNVGSPVVQTINGVYRDIHHCHEAAIVTTAGFTRAAIETNTMLPRPIRLINGDALVQWANGGLPPWR